MERADGGGPQPWSTMLTADLTWTAPSPGIRSQEPTRGQRGPVICSYKVKSYSVWGKTFWLDQPTLVALVFWGSIDKDHQLGSRQTRRLGRQSTDGPSRIPSRISADSRHRVCPAPCQVLKASSEDRQQLSPLMQENKVLLVSSRGY